MKVMIVDDEVIIRDGLSQVIEWDAYQFQLLEPAASAEEALDRVVDERPDIVLTDIRMTGKSGLELALEIKSIYPHTEVIVLSGYDEFAYAQQALRNGVSDYLLKTSGPDEILKAMIQSRQRILKVREIIEQGEVKEHLIRRQLLEKVLQGSKQEADHVDLTILLEQWPIMQRLHEGMSCRVIIIAFDGWGTGEAEKQLLQFAIANMLEELLRAEVLAWQEGLLIFYPVDASAGSDGLQMMQSAIRRSSETLKCQLWAGSSAVFCSLEQLRSAYIEALYASEFRWLLTGQQYAVYEQVQSRKGGRRLCSQAEESELISILIAGDLGQLRGFTTKILAELRADSEAVPASVEAYLQSIVVAAQRWLERALSAAGNDNIAAETHVEGQSLNQPFMPIPERKLSAYLEKIAATYRRAASGKSGYVQRATDYIKEHLDQNLTLQKVAEYVYVNPNYLSEMFKRQLGINYIDFVTTERMEKAKLLLVGTDAKIGEIAKTVGYEDIKYFTKLFKRHASLTPTEYRNQSEFFPPSY